MVPAPRPVRGQKLSWVLAILCGLLVVAAGVGTTIFVTDLNKWNKSIAENDQKIAALEEQQRSQKQTLTDRDSSLSSAIKDQTAAKDADNTAKTCQDAIDAFLQTSVSDQAAFEAAVTKAFLVCQVYR
jgi:hypothetical protein